MTSLLRAPPPATTVILGGEIDISTTPAIRQSLMAAISAGNISLTVDCAAITFIDAGGIGVLVAASNLARAAGGGLLLRDPSPRLRKILDIVHLDTRLRAVELKKAA